MLSAVFRFIQQRIEYIQCVARMMTKTRPATEAGVGVIVTNPSRFHPTDWPMPKRCQLQACPASKSTPIGTYSGVA